MAVVKNLLVRAGADFSAMRRELQKGQRSLSNFERGASRLTTRIEGRSGLGGLATKLEGISKKATGEIGRITAGLSGMSTAALAASSRLGIAGAAIGVFVTAVTLAIAGIAKASQGAVKFQADLDRLNMALGKSTKQYYDWARAQGMAKSTAAELGATYGVLLSSFIRDNGELGKNTQEIVQATRVVASATGRTIEDTFERIRSGLLGNTEAIEDLGIFVNVSMIESTNAFRRFAGDKSWDQLDFRIQQQIRLQAILEQAQARYGTTLQNNVMTKQSQLIEQWKDIKLHLSQAFLPLWDTILPGLIRLAEAVSRVTERIAIFMHQLFGMKYEATAVTESTSDQTDALDELGDAYDEVGKKAKKASRGVAAFDEVNQLNWGDGGHGSGSGGKGGSGSGGSGGSKTTTGLEGIDWDGLAGGLPKLQLEFLPPTPPDAGIGAVATAVTSTVDQLNAEVKAKMQGMWDSVGQQTITGRQVIEGAFAGMAGNVGGVIVPGLADNVGTQWTGMTSGMVSATTAGTQEVESLWSRMWSKLGALNTSGQSLSTTLWPNLMGQLNAQTDSGRIGIETKWGSLWSQLGLQNTTGSVATVGTWTAMIVDLIAGTTRGKLSLETLWSGLMETIKTKTEVTKVSVKTDWHNALDYLQTQLNSYRPYLELGWQLIQGVVMDTKTPLAETRSAWTETLEDMKNQLTIRLPSYQLGWGMIGLSVLSIIPSLENVRNAWNNALTDMQTVIVDKTATMIARINSVINAWRSMQVAISGGGVAAPAGGALGWGDALAPIPAPTPSPTGRPAWVDNAPVLGDIYKGLDWLANVTKPLSDAAMPYVVPGAGLSGAGSAAAGISTKLGQWLSKLFDDLAISVPAFASGAITKGPMLALVGDNPGGEEVISPLDDLVDIVQSAVSTAVVAANQMGQGGQQGGDIVIQVDGTTLARIVKPYLDDEDRRIGASAITTV